ncbi:5-(carboxyamino)imidazole ribonucleotide synthase [Lentibacillus sp. JNUCC-1]|uniref:5-(carboxyamino)imidazole ribonucleotide synthase n=1 Tax=Lentibacillus sp. JNUCC-1 TaxID=2654513 RepID=UPI0012E728EB|nr:5-(carboxyamino)imidazole ribonucleotide synthase [Lentibacillus sp. JNUCC-1]MUV38581.1 5-(carboxyamino)imidazole ribonucleotide synthase [Lentibacillus sp. JNUCC-1]
MQTNKIIQPPQTIGIIGGGQLGRMMALAVKYMGYRVMVLDPMPDCPTAQVADEHITAAYDDMNGIKTLVANSNVVTYEFENVDLEAASYIEETGKLPQGSEALAITQNREKEKQLMTSLNLPVPEFAIVHNAEECRGALKTFTFPAVIKTCSGGYDGKGQLKLTGPDDTEAAAEFAEKNGHCIIERWLSFDKEISTVFTRSKNGDIQFFPIAENEHRDHILYKTTAPAAVSDHVAEKAKAAAKQIAERMNIVGTFAIEMFVSGEDIHINEMAPRPHNSGHYTIEACNISQFGQHIRAICGLPLMNVQLLQPSVMINVLGDTLKAAETSMTTMPYGFFHLYGKVSVRPKRKMGHITFIAETQEMLQEQISMLEEAIQ